jgi:hypothetical protein
MPCYVLRVLCEVGKCPIVLEDITYVFDGAPEFASILKQEPSSSRHI